MEAGLVDQWREEFDDDLSSAVTSLADNGAASKSSTAVQLRKEQRNQFCGGRNYKEKKEPAGVVEGYALWVRDGVSEATLPKDVRSAFVNQILKPLHKAFDFPEANVRVLHDPDLEHLTAFNEKGCVYLNIRIFQRRHYVDGAIGNLGSALLFWYHTLAHEFAHNLVPSHNANFELVYSRLCQKYSTGIYTHPALKQAVKDSKVKVS